MPTFGDMTLYQPQPSWPAYYLMCCLTGKMPRLPDNLPRFFCCTARRSCHITCRDIARAVCSWSPAPFCLAADRISDRNAILSGRELARTLGAVRRQFPPSRRHNIWRESVAQAVKCPISWRHIDYIPHRTKRLYEDAPSYVTTLFELADCIY